jgi:hypothetical protein
MSTDGCFHRNGKEMNTNDQACITALVTFENAISHIPGYNLFKCNTIALPLEAETNLSGAWRTFELLDIGGWMSVRASITRKCAGGLLTYAVRMATLAVRTYEASHVYDGFFSLVVDERLMDYRDVCRVACVLYDAATRIHSSPDSLVTKLSRFAAPSRRDVLLGWLGGRDYTKTLRSMGFEAAETDFGLEYRIGGFA